MLKAEVQRDAYGNNLSLYSRSGAGAGEKGASNSSCQPESRGTFNRRCEGYGEVCAGTQLCGACRRPQAADAAAECDGGYAVWQH